MEQSDIRGSLATHAQVPDFAALHPGYALRTPYGLHAIRAWGHAPQRLLNRPRNH
jgi:hypothetical protein